MTTTEKVKRTLVGHVVSDKGDKTIVVQIVRSVQHPKYKKYIKRSKKFHAHDDANVGRVGDLVRIVASRPYSKLKTWVLQDVIEKSN